MSEYENSGDIQRTENARHSLKKNSSILLDSRMNFVEMAECSELNFGAELPSGEIQSI